MEFGDVPERARSVATAVQRVGGTVGQLSFGPGASANRIRSLRKSVGPIPTSIEVLLLQLGSASFTWDWERDLRDEWGGSRWGGFEWSLDHVASAEAERATAVREGYFEDGSDAADGNPEAAAIWSHAFAWLALANGDAIGLDASGAVIYTSATTATLFMGSSSVPRWRAIWSVGQTWPSQDLRLDNLNSS